MIGTKFDPSRPYAFVRYARMSMESQNPRSPDQQFDFTDAERRRGGYPWKGLRDYRDDAKSGRFMRKRPGFCRMLDDIRTGCVRPDLILVDTLERFGRMEELPTLRRELQNKHGVLVLTADSRFADPTSVAGRALGVVESMRATSDAHVKAHNVLRGKIDAARQKHWPGGPPPRGYRLKSIMKPNTEPAEVDYRVLIPDPPTAPMPQRTFTLAHEKGWGGVRIAKELNSDVEFVARYGKVSVSTVDYILSNPIYIGVLRFNRMTTDIIDDRRVSARNDDEDVIFVGEFCEPIVQREVFEAVQKQRRARSAQIRSARDRQQKSGGKQLKPLAPGVVLKHPLTGLVRCALCGAAMRPNRAGGAGYFYYACPGCLDGRCSNRRRVRGDWLWPVFVAHLRKRLLPPPGSTAPAEPPWLQELIADVRAELHRLAEANQNRRPLLQRELDDLDARISGWTQTLANPSLAATVRRHIEIEFNTAVQRKCSLESELSGLDYEVDHVEQLLDVDAAVDCLRRLGEVLGAGNPTSINLELARHVEAILVHPDGRVVMRIHRLGVFAGLTDTLANPVGGQSAEVAPEPRNGRNGQIKPRSALLTRHVPIADPAERRPGPMSSVTLRRVDLPERWVDETTFVMPERHTWAHLHATEVRVKARQTGWSQRKLAEHFGVTPPTIRHALQIGAQRGGSGLA